jgi:CheY-like chemotaxis protein
VLGDFTRLAQAFANLLNNAVKYTPRGGRIDVNVSATPTQSTVTIRDTGVGISEAALPKIFDMFMQSPESMTAPAGAGHRPHAGATSHRAAWRCHRRAQRRPRARQHVHDPNPRGGAGQPAAEQAEPPRRDVAKRRVLIAEDIPDAAEMMRTMIDLMGHEVRVAADGVQAVTMAKEFDPEVALLDIGCHVRTGIRPRGRSARRWAPASARGGHRMGAGRRPAPRPGSRL